MQKYYFESLDSTNDYLKSEYNSYEDKDVVIALVQKKGKGRMGRVWLSNDDLTFSIVFKNLNPIHHLIAPLAVASALKRLGINAKIKWPNDIYVSGKKVSGILVESIYEGNEFKCQIVGIGINFSIKENSEWGYLKEYDISDKNLILDLVINEYELLLNHNTDKIVALYAKENLLSGKRIEYENHFYRIIGFSESGELIASDGKKEVTINSGMIDIKKKIIGCLD